MSATVGRLRSAATPECGNLSKSIKISSLITMIVILIAFVLLGTAIGYNYIKKTTTTKAGSTEQDTSMTDDKKKKIVGALNISAVVVLGLALLSGVWEFSVVSRTVNNCLSV